MYYLLQMKQQFWNHYSHYLNGYILDKSSITHALTSFWNTININSLDQDQWIYIIFKVKFADDSFLSISYLQKVNKLQFNELLDVFIESFNFRADHDKVAENIIFTYHIFKPETSQGFRDSVSLDQLKSSMKQDSELELNQDKLPLDEGSITIKNKLYNIIATESNRELIYKNNLLVGTKSYKIGRDKTIV